MFKLFHGLRPGRGSSKYVACSDASAFHKFMADVVLTGTNDHTDINALLTAMGAGKLMISPGTVMTAGSIATTIAGQHILGSGPGATTIFAANSAGSNANLVNLGHANCSLQDLTIDGNKANNAGRTAMLCWNAPGADTLIRNVVAKNSAGNGVSISGAGAMVLGCQVTAAGFVGLVVNSTSRGQILGNTIDSNLCGSGGGGIYVSGTNNLISGNRCVGNGNNGIDIPPGGDNNLITGNICRTNGGVGIADTGTNNYITNNDLFNNTGGPLTLGGTNVRRTVKQQLDYVASTDLLNAAAITAATWTDVHANQTFRVDHGTSSLIEFSVMGAMLLGNSGTLNTGHSARLVIDSAGTPINKKLGGQNQEATNSFVNPISGGPVRIPGLAIGNHTVKLQIRSAIASTAYLRASSVPESEFLNIQVVEYA